jgi:hypothetical protein
MGTNVTLYARDAQSVYKVVRDGPGNFKGFIAQHALLDLPGTFVLSGLPGELTLAPGPFDGLTLISDADQVGRIFLVLANAGDGTVLSADENQVLSMQPVGQGSLIEVSLAV